MQILKNHYYWVGEPTVQSHQHVIQLQNVKDLPEGCGGMVCINFSTPSETNDAIKAFYAQPQRWSWCVFVTLETELSKCVTDGMYDAESALQTWGKIQDKLTTINYDQVDALIGWLGVNKERRVRPLKGLESASIYSYPIVELLFPELSSTYRYVLSEQTRGILESQHLVDRIRLCSNCGSGHLNYVEVCPNCNSIDIESQSSLHCFTCGHVSDQQSFLRRGRLECPKCLTQLRHIGVDYDRPLENHICNSCHHRFVEASTVSQCLSCSTQIDIENLIVRKIYQFALGEIGEYTFQHGKIAQAPTLSIKGKVDVSYFQTLLAWLNKVSIRHGDKHLLLGLHLPSLDQYGQQYGDTRLFALMDQLTSRLGELFRNTDICCQYRQDILLVLMPKTDESSLSVLQDKLQDLSELIDDNEFELNVFAWTIPSDELDADIEMWLESIVGEVYAAG